MNTSPKFSIELIKLQEKKQTQTNMKKILILFLTIYSISGFGQILVDPTTSISTARYNSAVQGKVNATGTDTYIVDYLNTGNANTGITTYTGLALTVQFANANTGVSTFNINGLGAKTIKKQSGGALVDLSANDIGPNERKDIYYDGTYIVLKGGTGSGSAGALLAANNLSDLANAGTARTNLGLGTLATQSGAFSGTSSGTNTGDQTTITGNAGTATTLQTARTIGTITGDATSVGSSFDGSANNTNALTLATVNSNVGSFGSATTSLTVTANAKGLITAISSQTVTPSVGSITGFASGIGAWLASSTSANLATAVTDETGSGALVFGTSPTLATPVINGLPTGTGVSAINSASTLVTRDASSNVVANNFIPTNATTATAAGTTTLTVSSARNQFFTGSTTQTVVLPVVSTLSQNGHPFNIYNKSTGAVTVQSSGGNTIQVMAANSSLEIKNILITGTTGSSWDYSYYPPNPMSGTGDTMYGNSTGEPTRLAIGSTSDIYTVVAGIPAWSTGLPGVTTNSNAASGKVGEYVSSLVAVGSATSFTTATAKNVTSISLTAGDWDVYGNINFTEGSATVTVRTAGISATSATLPTDGSEVENGTLTTVTSGKMSITLPTKRISIASTTTIYLVGSTTFSAGTSSGYGFIGARRAR
jgi:hypothetical protein